MYHRAKFVLFFMMVAFFISGASALIYQIVWLKKLSLVFGSTTLAVSTILACFMGGLALGSYLMAKNAFKIKKILLFYGILELCIGVYAFLLPNIFDIIDIIYMNIWPIAQGVSLLQILLRFILVSIALLLPTTLMGATLPLFVKYYIDKDDLIVKYTSLLYGINTLGAVVGAFICGFYFLENFGLAITNNIAVALNLVAFILAYSMEKKDRNETFICSFESNKIPVILEKNDYFLLIAMLLSGFTAMIYEVVWARQLVLIFGSTTYSYTCILVIFLIGVSLGSLFVRGFFKDNYKNIYYFAIFEVVLGVIVIVSTFYYPYLHYLYFILFNSLPQSTFIVSILVISSLLILPVAVVFGVLFPISIKLFTINFNAISERTGLIYSFNTIGCIFGSLSCGFLLIPIIGMKYSLLFAACLNIIIGGTYLYLNVYKKNIRVIALCLMILILFLGINYQADWSKAVIASGFVINRTDYKDLKSDTFFDKLKIYDIAYYKESYHSTIAVVKWAEDQYCLYNNGKVDASTNMVDVRTQAFMGYLPALIKKNIDDVLVIGLGTGMTVAVVEQFPVKTIELIELEEAVVGVVDFFSKKYGNPFDDNRLKLIIDDARNYLRVVDKKYDLIISEPSNVWVSGVANLFTQNYYHDIKQKLKSDGMLCQWLQCYNLDDEAVKSVLKALSNEFAYVYIFNVKTGKDLVFIASSTPLKLDELLINERINQNRFTKSDLFSTFNILNSKDVLNLCLANNASLKEYLNMITPNTDDNSFLEFKAVKSFLSEFDKKNEFSVLRCLKLLGGLSKQDVYEPASNLFKSLSIAAAAQFDRSLSSQIELEIKERPLYKYLMKKYAVKYNQEFPQLVDSIELLGLVSLDSNETVQGIKYLEQAVSKNSVNPNVYRLLSRYYNNILVSENTHYSPDKALKYSKRLMELEPDNVYNIYLLGVSYKNNHQTIKARELLDQYYKLSRGLPIDKGFYEIYGQAYFSD